MPWGRGSVEETAGSWVGDPAAPIRHQVERVKTPPPCRETLPVGMLFMIICRRSGVRQMSVEAQLPRRPLYVASVTPQHQSSISGYAYGPPPPPGKQGRLACF